MLVKNDDGMYLQQLSKAASKCETPKMGIIMELL